MDCKQHHNEKGEDESLLMERKDAADSTPSSSMDVDRSVYAANSVDESVELLAGRKDMTARSSTSSVSGTISTIEGKPGTQGICNDQGDDNSDGECNDSQDSSSSYHSPLQEMISSEEEDGLYVDGLNGNDNENGDIARTLSPQNDTSAVSETKSITYSSSNNDTTIIAAGDEKSTTTKEEETVGLKTGRPISGPSPTNLNQDELMEEEVYRPTSQRFSYNRRGSHSGYQRYHASVLSTSGISPSPNPTDLNESSTLTQPSVKKQHQQPLHHHSTSSYQPRLDEPISAFHTPYTSDTEHAYNLDSPMTASDHGVDYDFGPSSHAATPKIWTQCDTADGIGDDDDEILAPQLQHTSLTQDNNQPTIAMRSVDASRDTLLHFRHRNLHPSQIASSREETEKKDDQYELSQQRSFISPEYISTSHTSSSGSTIIRRHTAVRSSPNSTSGNTTLSSLPNSNNSNTTNTTNDNTRRSIKSSLDSGMMTLKRWVRSHMGSNSNASNSIQSNRRSRDRVRNGIPQHRRQGSSSRPMQFLSSRSSRAAMLAQLQSEMDDAPMSLRNRRSTRTVGSGGGGTVSNMSHISLGQEDVFALHNTDFYHRGRSLPSSPIQPDIQMIQHEVNQDGSCGDVSVSSASGGSFPATTLSVVSAQISYPPAILEEEAGILNRQRAFSEPDQSRRTFFAFRRRRKRSRLSQHEDSGDGPSSRSIGSYDSRRSIDSGRISSHSISSESREYLPNHQPSPGLCRQQGDELDMAESGMRSGHRARVTFHSTISSSSTSSQDNQQAVGVGPVESSDNAISSRNITINSNNRLGTRDSAAHSENITMPSRVEVGSSHGDRNSDGSDVVDEDPNREARRNWLLINRRFHFVVVISSFIFSILLFAILLCWVALTSAYVVSIDKRCDVPLKPYFWCATLQLILDVFRADIVRYCLRWNPNSSPRQPIPPRVIVYNISYVTYALLVLRTGLQSIYFRPEGTMCQYTAPELWRTSEVYVTISFFAWAIILLGYLIPFCFVAIVLTHNGYSPYMEGDGSDTEERRNFGLFSTAYSANAAPTATIDQMQEVSFENFRQEYPKECCICMGEFSQGDRIVLTECDHVFHRQCCKEWLKQARTCPICRLDIPSSLNMEDDDVTNHLRFPGPFRSRELGMEMRSLFQYFRGDSDRRS